MALKHCFSQVPQVILLHPLLYKGGGGGGTKVPRPLVLVLLLIYSLCYLTQVTHPF